MDSKAKSGNIAVLVDQYTRRLKKYLKTGTGTPPNPHSFMDKHTKQANRRELQLHLNMTTLLVLYGTGQNQEAQKALKKGDFLKKSRQKFFDNLKKSSGVL